MAFLDDEGLSYYNSKITAQISSKQNAIFSDGSPDIQVKQVTLQEYEALPEEDKMLPIIYLLKSSEAASSSSLKAPSASNSLSSNSDFKGSSFDISYDPVNDEGIMTMEAVTSPQSDVNAFEVDEQPESSFCIALN